MTLKKLATALLGLALSAPSSALPQTSQTPRANFRGVVVDAYVARIPGAALLVEGVGRKWNLRTDADGDTIGEINVELPAGEYKFTVEAQGFKPLVVRDFRVAPGAKISYEFRMEVRDCSDCDGTLYPKNLPPAPRAPFQLRR